MTRVKDWEKRLKIVTQKHMALPSVYGVSDCYIIADDAVEAVIGEQMYPGVRNYKTEKGAAKKLQQHGFSTVEHAFAAKFETIAPSLAQRGDIGVIYDNGVVCGGFFTALGFATRNKDDLVFVPVGRVKFAFKVGR